MSEREPAQTTETRGSIELICGCMFSGKTERLLELLADAQKRSIPTAAFKHADDDRYGRGQLVSHSGRRVDAFPVASAQRIIELAGDAQWVAIDEAQFFSGDLVTTCQRLKEQGRKVVVAGLDLDSWGEPFGPVPDLETVADVVTRTHAVCSVCGEPADHTQRLTPVGGQKMIGGPEAYEPRCERCFRPPPSELRR